MASSSGQGKPIPLTSLNIQELGRIKGMIEEELKGTMEACRKLEHAAEKFSESKSCLLALGPGSLNKEVMIPLTSSLYVAGAIDCADRVLVDLGTKYYMDASIPEAANYLNRQIKVAQENLSTLSTQAQNKSKQREAVVMIMQQKIAEAAKNTAPPTTN